MTEPSCLASTSTRRWLCRYVSSRVPACDVEDVVQATLLDAVASARAPDRSEDLERWLLGIARYKVVDAHRARGRTRRTEATEAAACAPSVEAVAMAEWAARQLPPGPSGARTLRWMVREAEGEKLEAIADEEGLPAERVRQRVSRLRRFMRDRWRAELGALALLLIAAAGLRAVLAPPTQAAIVAEGDPSVPLRGTWRLAEFTPEASLGAACQPAPTHRRPARNGANCAWLARTQSSSATRSTPMRARMRAPLAATAMRRAASASACSSNSALTTFAGLSGHSTATECAPASISASLSASAHS